MTNHEPVTEPSQASRVWGRECHDHTTLDDTCRAFREWTPSRPVRADGSGAFIHMENGGYPGERRARCDGRGAAAGLNRLRYR